jgi:hypothetical protein
MHLCNQCGSKLFFKKHKKFKEKLLKQPFFFTGWFKCPKCKGYIKLIEENKVYKGTPIWYKEIEKLKSIKSTNRPKKKRRDDFKLSYSGIIEKTPISSAPKEYLLSFKWDKTIEDVYRSVCPICKKQRVYKNWWCCKDCDEKLSKEEFFAELFKHFT